MKRIICNISDLSLEKSFKIDIDQCETDEYLKKLIAAELNLTKDQFEIANLPTQHQLQNTNKSYKIDIYLKHLSQEVIFQFPNKKQELIKIQCKTRIKDLVNCYFKKKKIIYHEKCIKYLKFIVCGVEIPADYSLLYVPEGSVVHVKDSNNFITIEYRDFLFFFPVNEIIATVQSLIAENIKSFNIFEIHNASHEQLSLTYKIKKGEDYIIYARQFFNVRNIFDKSSTTKHYNLDPFTTVNELKSFLALTFSENGQQIDPEDINILDQYKSKVCDPNTTLLSLQNDGKIIYFDIGTSNKQEPQNSIESLKNRSQEKSEEKNEKAKQDEELKKNSDYPNNRKDATPKKKQDIIRKSNANNQGKKTAKTRTKPISITNSRNDDQL